MRTRNAVRKGRFPRWLLGLPIVMIGAHLLMTTVLAGSVGHVSSWALPILMALMMVFMGPPMMQRRPGPGSDESPSAILARRFARGELTQNQYAQMEQSLRDHAAVQPDSTSMS
jgi:uncharacterized membrane protein